MWMIDLLLGYVRTRHGQQGSQTPKKIDIDHLETDISEDRWRSYKTNSPSATLFLASVRIKDAFPIFTTYFWDRRQLKNKGETPNCWRIQ
jgi:hypothetical protein